jgi:hypothetical protein
MLKSNIAVLNYNGLEFCKILYSLEVHGPIGQFVEILMKDQSLVQAERPAMSPDLPLNNFEFGDLII